MQVPPRKAVKSFEWEDVRSRFLARVCKVQDLPPLVRMDLRVPRIHGTHMNCRIEEHLDDNLFIDLQETLELRPHIPHNAMVVNPDVSGVSVCVDNFWVVGESGGNSGRVVRRAVVYVSGDAEALRRLRGGKDTCFTRRGAARRTTADVSGVRGLTHTLQGGVHIRRMRTNELESGDDFGSRWVCIDYTSTHVLHCRSTPRCVVRNRKQSPMMNPRCCNPSDLYLVRQREHEHNPNAIAVLCRDANNQGVVGYVPPGIASCLAPAMDTFAVMADSEGIYADVLAPAGDKSRNRVWFRVDGSHHSGDGGPASHLVDEKLQAIPWWLVDDSRPVAAV